MRAVCLPFLVAVAYHTGHVSGTAEIIVPCPGGEAAQEADRRVEVSIDGQPFTAYIWPTSLKKPVLYPIRTAKGTLITRGFPLDPRPSERVTSRSPAT